MELTFWEIDVLGVDILGVDILRLTPHIYGHATVVYIYTYD